MPCGGADLCPKPKSRNRVCDHQGLKAAQYNQSGGGNHGRLDIFDGREEMRLMRETDEKPSYQPAPKEPSRVERRLSALHRILHQRCREAKRLAQAHREIIGRKAQGGDREGAAPGWMMNSAFLSRRSKVFTRCSPRGRNRSVWVGKDRMSRIERSALGAAILVRNVEVCG